MSVLDFVNRLNELNNLINYYLDINNVNPKPLEDTEKMGILHKACPKEWTDTITKSNLKFTTYRSLVTYYQRLKSTKKMNNNNSKKRNYNQSKNNGNKKKNNHNKNQNGNGNNGNGNFKS
eukprot:5061430-Ditylum_brightwellii.AAC.1